MSDDAPPRRSPREHKQRRIPTRPTEGLILCFVVPSVVVPVGRGLAISLPIILGVVVVVWILLTTLSETMRARCTIAALRRAGHCGACGYSLQGGSPEADGCQVCTECGAAWRR